MARRPGQAVTASPGPPLGVTAGAPARTCRPLARVGACNACEQRPPWAAPRRQDGKVSFGYSAMRGKRASMEDYYHAQVRARAPPLGSPGRLRAESPRNDPLSVVLADIAKSPCPRAERSASIKPGSGARGAPRGTSAAQPQRAAPGAERRPRRAQFKKHPKNGEVVGLFGVFDGARADPAQPASAGGLRSPVSARATGRAHDACCARAGHGGSNAAAFVQAHLFDSLLANSNFNSDIHTAMGPRPPPPAPPAAGARCARSLPTASVR